MFALKSTLRAIPRTSTTSNKLKFLSTSLPPGKANHDAASRLLDRIQYYVWNKYPTRALARFHKELSSGRIPVNQRSDLYDAVIRVFVQYGHRYEAESVLHRLETSEHILSTSLYGTVTTHEFVTGKITTDVFLKKIEKVVSSPSYSEKSFLGLLSHLYRMNCPGDVLDQVAHTFIRTKELGPRGVSTVIHLLMQKGELARTAPWFDYHSDRVTSKTTPITEEDAAPYTTYMEELLSMTKTSKPETVYGPVMKKMLEDGVWPDIQYLNTAIEAEARHGNTKSAFHLYGLIRSLSYRGLLPTDVTYSHLFSGFIRDYQIGRLGRGYDMTPRRLFFEMMVVHKLGTAQGRLPVATSVSLGSALLTFSRIKDYAAACCTLRTLQTLRCPFPDLFARKIVTLLVHECLHDLRLDKPGQRTSWVTAFLGLGSDVRRRRFQHASLKDIHKRVLDIGRHNLTDAPNVDEPILEDDTVPGASSVPTRTPVREKKINKMRQNKFEFMFTLLSRASSACFASEDTPLDVVRKFTVRAYEDAKAALYPTDAEVQESAFAEW